MERDRARRAARRSTRRSTRCYREGGITLDEALQNADSANNLKLKLKLQGVDTDGGADRAELKLTLMKGVRAREPMQATAAQNPPLKLGGGPGSGGR